jgi:hypothetical protein
MNYLHVTIMPKCTCNVDHSFKANKDMYMIVSILKYQFYTDGKVSTQGIYHEIHPLILEISDMNADSI